MAGITKVLVECILGVADSHQLGISLLVLAPPSPSFTCRGNLKRQTNAVDLSSTVAILSFRSQIYSRTRLLIDCTISLTAMSPDIYALGEEEKDLCARVIPD
jgi:hypothetical protein